MGVRGLGAAVSRHGEHSPLSGDTVVIDGPALIYRIHEACSRQCPPGSGFICQPPYSLLGGLTIGWLEQLRHCQVEVRMIYFDGYLPPSKWDVRKERLISQSKATKALISAYPRGSSRPPEHAFSEAKVGMALPQTSRRLYVGQELPKPPFLVPAVIEALRSSEYWCSLIQVVPGEADMFCAEDVRINGGTVLTSDSDLLLQDLGPHGRVCFFNDITPSNDPSETLTARQMSPREISEQLGITNIGGLLRVAFELKHSYVSFNQALQKAKSNRQGNLSTPEFQLFEEEYCTKHYLAKNDPMFDKLSFLDPRISEIVVQTLLFQPSENTPRNSTPKMTRGPDDLAMFLPIMIEHRERRSVWTTSTITRQIAYGVLQEFAPHRSSNIIEYRTIDSSTSLPGRQVSIPDSSALSEQCDSLVKTLLYFKERFSSEDLHWLVFAINDDVQWSVSEQKPSLAAMILAKERSLPKDSDGYPWDLIHFTAQVQASLYSLRMLKQVLSLYVSLRRDCKVQLCQLRDLLESLPPLAQWPTVQDLSLLVPSLQEANVLSTILDMIGCPEVQTVQIRGVSHKPKKNHKKRKIVISEGRSQEGRWKSLTANPFAILNQVDRD